MCHALVTTLSFSACAARGTVIDRRRNVMNVIRGRKKGGENSLGRALSNPLSKYPRAFQITINKGALAGVS